jgi:hypothetical protein
MIITLNFAAGKGRGGNGGGDRWARGGRHGLALSTKCQKEEKSKN